MNEFQLSGFYLNISLIETNCQPTKRHTRFLLLLLLVTCACERACVCVCGRFVTAAVWANNGVRII